MTATSHSFNSNPLDDWRQIDVQIEVQSTFTTATVTVTIDVALPSSKLIISIADLKLLKTKCNFQS